MLFVLSWNIPDKINIIQQRLHHRMEFNTNKKIKQNGFYFFIEKAFYLYCGRVGGMGKWEKKGTVRQLFHKKD